MPRLHFTGVQGQTQHPHASSEEMEVLYAVLLTELNAMRAWLQMTLLTAEDLRQTRNNVLEDVKALSAERGRM